MLEILYRIYEVASEEEQEKAMQSYREIVGFNSISKRINNELFIA